MEAETAGGIGAMGLLFSLAFIALMIASLWKVFTKAGQPGWASIIPIYNFIVILQIIGKPWWWIIGMIIPFVNFVVFIMLAIELARVFGKGIGYAIGLILLPFVFYPMLAFGDATYRRPMVPAPA